MSAPRQNNGLDDSVEAGTGATAKPINYVVLASGIVIAGSILLCVGVTIADCRARKETIPVAPIYPDSELTYAFSNGTVSGYGAEYHTYTTSDTYEEVNAFFAARAGCLQLPPSEIYCRGSAEPFGVFEVSLSKEQPAGSTTYDLDILWNKCGRNVNDFFFGPRPIAE
jgi:hypothetical protein